MNSPQIKASGFHRVSGGLSLAVCFNARGRKHQALHVALATAELRTISIVANATGAAYLRLTVR